MTFFQAVVRSLLFYGFMALTVGFYWLAITVGVFLPFSFRYAIGRHWCKSVIFMARIICGIRFRLEGTEHLKGPAIVLSKHQSAWETLFFVAYLKRPVVFILKRELLLIPFFGWALALLRMIPIDRRKYSFKYVQEKVRQRLREGQYIVIFPEGTRALPGKPLPFKVGGAVLAQKTETEIVPVALNTGLFWQKGSWIKYPGEIKVRFYPPVSAGQENPVAFMAKLKRTIDDATTSLEEDAAKQAKNLQGRSRA